MLGTPVCTRRLRNCFGIDMVAILCRSLHLSRKGMTWLRMACCIDWCLRSMQVATMFVPLAREGWLQKLVATKLHPFGVWKVFWVELLEDGKLSWFDGAAKRRTDFRRASPCANESESDNANEGVNQEARDLHGLLKSTGPATERTNESVCAYVPCRMRGTRMGACSGHSQ